MQRVRPLAAAASLERQERAKDGPLGIGQVASIGWPRVAMLPAGVQDPPMGFLAGLEVSLEETAICIVIGAGTIIRKARAASKPEALSAFFTGCGMVMSASAWKPGRVGVAAWRADGGGPARVVHRRPQAFGY